MLHKHKCSYAIFDTCCSFCCCIWRFVSLGKYENSLFKNLRVLLVDVMRQAVNYEHKKLCEILLCDNKCSEFWALFKLWLLWLLNNIAKLKLFIFTFSCYWWICEIFVLIFDIENIPNIILEKIFMIVFSFDWVSWGCGGMWRNNLTNENQLRMIFIAYDSW